MERTLQEVRLEIDIKNVAAETLNGVVEGQDVDAFAVLDVQALMYVHQIAELDAKVVARDLVHLNLALFDVIRAQADENRVSPLLSPVSKM